MDEKPLFRCEKCNKEFKLEKHMRQHISRKTPCVIGPNETVGDHKCKYCNRAYSSKYTLARHMSSCSTKKEDDPHIKMEEKMRVLEEERLREREETQKKLLELQAAFTAKIIELEAKLANSQQVNSGPVNNGTVNNDNRTVNNTINILMTPNPYYAPNVDYLLKHADEVIADVHKHGITLPETLVDSIYFNKNHPENMSVHCINERKGEYYAYGRDGWEFVDADKVADRMRLVTYMTSVRMIETHCTSAEHIGFGQQIKQYAHVRDKHTEKEIENIKTKVASRKDVSKKVLSAFAPEVGAQIVIRK